MRSLEREDQDSRQGFPGASDRGVSGKGDRVARLDIFFSCYSSPTLRTSRLVLPCYFVIRGDSTFLRKILWTLCHTSGTNQSLSHPLETPLTCGEKIIPPGIETPGLDLTLPLGKKSRSFGHGSTPGDANLLALELEDNTQFAFVD